MALQQPSSRRERLAHRAFRAGLLAPRTSATFNIFDAAFPANTPAQYKAAGVVGFVRYVGPFTESKNMGLAEYRAWQAAGMPMGLVRESTGGAWVGGRSAGISLGQEARAHARTDAEWPDDRPVYTADFDRDIPASSFPTCAAFMDGYNVGGGCGPQGAYGEGDLLVYLKARGLIRWGWESESTSFPGNAGVSPAANMLQRVSHHWPQFDPNSYDENMLVNNTVDWGQHPAPAEVITAQDKLDIAQAVWS